jgi:3-oxoacyl-[acyl-carrier-protein] synthase-3
MIDSPEAITDRLLSILRKVQQNLGGEVPASGDGDTRFADALDSMGMLEFVATLAEDCGVETETIERCVGQRFTTVAEAANSLHAAGLVPRASAKVAVSSTPSLQSEPFLNTLTSQFLPRPHLSPSEAKEARASAWLSSWSMQLPQTVQTAAAINDLIHRPAGWLERHAGIKERRVWGDQNPVDAAAQAGRECLERAQMQGREVGALLVTSEAPPVLIGLATALHHRLGLPSTAVALETGGACNGFLAALWLARTLVAQVGAVLIVSVEAPTRHLQLRPGPSGEGAALFGDAAAAVILTLEAAGQRPTPLVDVRISADGSAGEILRIERSANGIPEICMKGVELASRAIEVMAQSVSEIARSNRLAVADLSAVVAHGGNGRMPALLGRKLWLPPDRIWSETPLTGNLGSASLPVAWATRQPGAKGPVAWTAVGAGLNWGAALLGSAVT